MRAASLVLYSAAFSWLAVGSLRAVGDPQESSSSESSLSTGVLKGVKVCGRSPRLGWKGSGEGVGRGSGGLGQSEEPLLLRVSLESRGVVWRLGRRVERLGGCRSEESWLLPLQEEEEEEEGVW